MIENYMKLGCYMVSLVAVMMGLSCINFEKFIRQNKVAYFYLLYVCVCMALTYLVANFLLDILSIRLG